MDQQLLRQLNDVTNKVADNVDAITRNQEANIENLRELTDRVKGGDDVDPAEVGDLLTDTLEALDACKEAMEATGNHLRTLGTDANNPLPEPDMIEEDEGEEEPADV